MAQEKSTLLYQIEENDIKRNFNDHKKYKEKISKHTKIAEPIIIKVSVSSYSYNYLNVAIYNYIVYDF